MEKHGRESESLEKGGMKVELWGTRGSCPAPFPNRMGYGGNTSCISASWEEGLAVFDGGTGILALGQQMEREGRWDVPIHIFIGHLHLDHITGLILFPGMFRKEARIHLYGPSPDGESFQTRLNKVLGPPYWPVSVSQVPARVVWHDGADGDSWELPGGALVRAMASNHPNGGLLYRLEKDGRSMVYGMDCELGEENRSEYWERYKDFARDCDLLLFDAPYTREEYPCFRGFGHSFWEQGLEMAGACRARRLCICHHNWDREDEALKKAEMELTQRLEGAGRIGPGGMKPGEMKSGELKPGGKVWFAKEGDWMIL